MPKQINWPLLGSIVAGVAGVVGTVVTAIWGADAGTSAQAILQSLSALLIAIPTFHLTAVAAATTKAMRLQRINSNVLFAPPEHVKLIDPTGDAK